MAGGSEAPLVYEACAGADHFRASGAWESCSGVRALGGVASISGRIMTKHRIFTMPFAKVYPLYVQKAERKGRTRAEVDEIICWLTGYSPANLRKQIDQHSGFETFFAKAPQIHPHAGLITGVVCGVRVQEIEDPLMQKIRYLDKLVDELAKGKPMEKILRQ